MIKRVLAFACVGLLITNLVTVILWQECRIKEAKREPPPPAQPTLPAIKKKAIPAPGVAKPAKAPAEHKERPAVVDVPPPFSEGNLPPPAPPICPETLVVVDTVMGWLELTVTASILDSTIAIQPRVIAPPPAPQGASKGKTSPFGLLAAGAFKPDPTLILALRITRLFLGGMVNPRGGGIFAGLQFNW